MDKHLQKKIEETAKEYTTAMKNGVSIEVNENSIEDIVLKKCLEICYNAFKDGAEFGHRETIAQSKKWVEKNLYAARAGYTCTSPKNVYNEGYNDGKIDGVEEILDAFNNYMNKK